jgi:peptidoglycan hydrolase CwlO-like protein
MSRKHLLSAIVAAAMAFSFTAYASAQDNSNNQQQRSNNDRGGDRGRGNWDPAQFRQRMMDGIKEQLGSSDDEWKVLEPRVSKVMDLQRDTRSFSFGFGRGGDRSRTDSGTQSQVQKAASDLRSALEDKSISADEIARRLTSYRQAKEQAKTDLTKAQADLKELLSQRQEAQLVMAGMLD